MKKLVTIGLIFLLTSGCVHKTPLVSHAHMGHTLTAWHDTPGQQGLFVIAAKETDIAFQEVRLAVEADDVRTRRQHLDNVVNALNPDAQAIGTGLGYGAIRALEGAIDHLEFAASSEDASENLVHSVLHISQMGDDIVSSLKKAQALAQELSTLPPNEQYERIFNLQYALGVALKGDGQNKGNPGLQQIDQNLVAMLARETDPPYEPVSRRYVLGLVKLPNGTWAFRLPRRQRTPGTIYMGGVGYGGLTGY